MTPEGKIKKRVSAILKEYALELYYFMPVPSGYGESTLDYIGCIAGCFFAIETKRPGGKLTERQAAIRNRIVNAGGAVFVIDEDGGFDMLALEAWLRRRQ